MIGTELENSNHRVLQEAEQRISANIGLVLQMICLIRKAGGFPVQGCC